MSEKVKKTENIETPKTNDPEVVIDVKNLSVGFTVRGKKVNVIRNINLNSPACLNQMVVSLVVASCLMAWI